MPFEDDLGVRRHLQIGADRLDQLGARTAQQAGEGIFGQRIGHRRHRTENRRRVRAQCHGDRVRPIRVFIAPFTEIQGPTTMAEPAHDHLVAADDLLAVDTEVLPLLVRPLGDGQTPGDQRRGVARPAVLYGDCPQVDVITFDDHFLAGRVLENLGRHADDLLVDRQLAPGVLQPLRRLRLLEKRQQLADLTQFGDILGAHTEGDPLRRAEQIAEHRHVETRRVLEEQCRALLAQGAVTDFGHFQNRGDSSRDALELTAFFQAADKVAQIAILHA